MLNLGTQSKITRVIDATVAGTSDVNGATIDMKGFEAVCFVVLFGTITATAVTSIKVQQGAASDLSDAADLTGTSVSVAADDDDQVAYVEVVKPRERYVRVVVDRGTANAVLDGAIAIQTNPKSEPTTHDSTTVVGGETHLSPAEGTA